MNKENNHLPLFGVGPVYAAVVIGMTVLAVLFRNHPVLSSGKFGASLQAPLRYIGIVLIILAVIIWLLAVVVAKVDDNILKNQLVTTGIYAWVRNPIYSAIMIGCTGILFTAGNAWFFFLPLFWWLFMTVLMKRSEEKWLKDMYGREYEDYCARVNRCWPWFPKEK